MRRRVVIGFGYRADHQRLAMNDRADLLAVGPYSIVRPSGKVRGWLTMSSIVTKSSFALMAWISMPDSRTCL